MILPHIAIWKAVLLLLALVPLGYYIAAILATRRFFGKSAPRPAAGFSPPISILKPVHGIDFASYENFSSFCRQNYPLYEILFCVNSLDDKAVPLVHRLVQEFPHISIRLLSDAPQIGTNRKVNNLALLTREAKYDILVQSDGDVRVGPDYVRNLTVVFADPNVGVASCLYRGVAQPNLFARLEALGAASDFHAGALVADWKEGITFALGASVATTKSWLARIGGYEALANQLADDYEIGNRVHKAGGKVLLSQEIVATMYPALGAKEFWEHQLRWARTVRICRPASFLALIVTQGLPWAILAALVAPFAWLSAAYLAAYAVLRIVMAWVVGVQGLNDDVVRSKWYLIPLRDLIYFGVWLASFVSNRVTWGGVEYVMKSREMFPMKPSTK